MPDEVAFGIAMLQNYRARPGMRAMMAADTLFALYSLLYWRRNSMSIRKCLAIIIASGRHLALAGKAMICHHRCSRP